MRLWTLHPKYLDVKGLVALWREGLLAQKVIESPEKGYSNHSQLVRFKNTEFPTYMVAKYLEQVYNEAENRGYNFNKKLLKLSEEVADEKLSVTMGQFDYEWQWLQQKLKDRCYDKYVSNQYEKVFECNPIFRLVDGPIESWEKVK